MICVLVIHTCSTREVYLLVYPCLAVVYMTRVIACLLVIIIPCSGVSYQHEFPY